MSTSHIDRSCRVPYIYVSACDVEFESSCRAGSATIETAVETMVRAAVRVVSNLEEKAMTVKQVWERRGAGPEEQSVLVRVSVVESVLAGLRAAQLSSVEYLAVVGEILALLAKEATVNPAVVVVSQAVVEHQAELFAAVVESKAPFLVAETVERLVEQASPELWAQVLAALEASDAELEVMVQARAAGVPYRPADN